MAFLKVFRKGEQLFWSYSMYICPIYKENVWMMGEKSLKQPFFNKTWSFQASKLAGKSQNLFNFQLSSLCVTIQAVWLSSKQKIRGSQSECSLQPIRMQHSALIFSYVWQSPFIFLHAWFCFPVNFSWSFKRR